MNDPAPAEHAWHWLLDALHRHRRGRGERFHVSAREVADLRERLAGALRRRELTPRQAVADLQHELGRCLAERHRVHRRGIDLPHSPATCPAPFPWPAAAALRVALPRRALATHLQTLPPWLWEPFPARRRSRRVPAVFAGRPQGEPT